jgi:DNA recombination protein RmuC
VTEIIAAVAGMAIGAAAVLIAGRARAASSAAERDQLRARVASSEALEAELRRQLAGHERERSELHAAHERERSELRGALEGERIARAEADTRWTVAREALDEQRRGLDEARLRLGETFKALSTEALERSGAAFLERAREALDAQLGRREAAVHGLLRPLHDALGRYEDAMRSMETARQHAYGSLQEQLRSLAAGHADLQRETGALVAALRTPHVRGRWGELTLRRVVELAGLTRHCDFAEQVTVDGASGRIRPDMVVRLPAGREIVVDAKVSLSAYLDALAAPSEDVRAECLARHAQQVRQHMNALASRGYWDEFARAADLVVMFIPGEAFVAAAAEADAALIEDGLARKVVVATPTTLIALLRAIAYGWRQEHVAENAARISELGRQLHERLRALTGHLAEMGAALGRATAAYNRAVGSMEARVLPAARRFQELGAAAGQDLPALPPVAERPRGLTGAPAARVAADEG